MSHAAATTCILETRRHKGKMMKCKETQNQNARRRSYFVWCTKNITHKSLVVPFEQPKWYIFRGRIALRTQTLVTRDLCSFACVHTHTRDWCVGFACLLVFFSLLLFSLQAIWCYKYSNVVHFKRFRTNRFSFLSFLATHWFRTIRNLMKIKKRQTTTKNTKRSFSMGLPIICIYTYGIITTYA